MSRPRRFGHDYAYGLEHYERFPEQYERMEHRFKLADVDWCEFCGYCHSPVMLCEMWRDRSKPVDLNDKSTTVMGRLARGAGIPVYLVGVYTYRPPEVQAEIDRLNARVLELTRQWPMTRIRAQERTAGRSEVAGYVPSEWWEVVAGRHSEHHLVCEDAQRSGERLANPHWLEAVQQRHRRIWTPHQQLLIPS
jgi:hypothetical protein